MPLDDIIRNSTRANTKAGNNANSNPGGYRGTVVDVLDPELRGRVRVRVDGLHTENVIVEHLPWAENKAISGIAGPNEKGTSSVPLLDAKVNVSFAEGDWNQPVVEASPNIANPAQTLVNFGKSPVAQIKIPNRVLAIPKAFGGTWDETPDTTEATVYPFNTVTETGIGHVFQWDDTPGNSRVMVMHYSGTFTEMIDDGSFTMKTMLDKKEIVEGDNAVLYAGEFSSTIYGESYRKIDGDSFWELNMSETIEILEEKTETVGGDNVVTYESNFTSTIEGDSSRKIDGDSVWQLNSSENISISDKKTETVGGDNTVSYNSNFSSSISGTSTRKVGGKSTKNISGGETIKSGPLFKVVADIIELN